MERRSFFSIVAGFVFGASRVDREFPISKPDPGERLVSEQDFSPASPTHRDLSAMFADIRKFVDSHPGATVLSSDDPSSRLFGYSVFVSSKAGYDEVSSFFSVHITSMCGFEGREMVMLGTAAGRRALAVDLMKGTI